jgi:uracil-DNA glycosylase
MEVHPKVIVTLGKHSLWTMGRKFGFQKKLGQSKITDLAGKPIYLDTFNLYIYPCLHPHFISRQKGMRFEEYLAHFAYLALSLPGWLKRKKEGEETKT